MTTPDPEQRAIRFAEQAHAAQRYGADAPYTVHLAAVRRVLADFGIAGDLAVAAWRPSANNDEHQPERAEPAQHGTTAPRSGRTAGASRASARSGAYGLGTGSPTGLTAVSSASRSVASTRL
jgi:hypothetical protein